jgi:hypothetical protein
MTDLPAHVKFPPNDEGWVVSDDSDVITSIQAFVDGPELVIELWGSTTVISPDDEHYADHKFQDNSWTNLSDYSWRDGAQRGRSCPDPVLGRGFARGHSAVPQRVTALHTRPL